MKLAAVVLGTPAAPQRGKVSRQPKAARKVPESTTGRKTGVPNGGHGPIGLRIAGQIHEAAIPRDNAVKG
ncbi:hypothetical protein FA13DRAFT_1127322 [Coprinellus micaceus]|uniref:Uncharacterized protein n=1 Tax=Coprinellus micaceus TaxID=71717 RepID=A0A4Y7RJU8_COPMI|nr:hypothetical protein FA13DRAFT_1127322 [Coprinellus micaceus]